MSARTYACLRVALGAWLAWFGLSLVPWAAEVFGSGGMLPDARILPLWGILPNPLGLASAWLPAAWCALLGLGGILVAAGRLDRSAAVVAWFLLACLVDRNPLIANPALPYIGLCCLMHALTPRPTDRHAWERPALAGAVIGWLVMLGYTYAGITKLGSASWADGSALARLAANPLARDWWGVDAIASLPAWLTAGMTWGALALETAAAPLWAWRRIRPWLWLALVAMHLGILLVVDFSELTAAMLVVHLWCADPRWLAPGSGGTVFYDGSCGFCQGWVRTLAEEDRAGRLRFAPIGGDTWTAQGRTAQADSIQVATDDGRVLERWAAATHLAAAVGGVGRIAAGCMRLVPLQLGDRCYDGIARIRHRLAKPPTGPCPLLPRELRGRFGS